MYIDHGSTSVWLRYEGISPSYHLYYEQYTTKTGACSSTVEALCHKMEGVAGFIPDQANSFLN
jgi:hypothetical protein